MEHIRHSQDLRIMVTSEGVSKGHPSSFFGIMFISFAPPKEMNDCTTARLQDIFCPDGGMVDTQDLKSCDHCGCAGSSPAPGTEKE